MSLKVIETGLIRKLGCSFLFTFYSNCGTVLYCLWDIATYYRKSLNFYILPVFSTSAGDNPMGISQRCLILIKVEWLVYHTVKTVWHDNMLGHFDSIPERDGQTDGWTDRTAIPIFHVSVLMHDKNQSHWPTCQWKTSDRTFISTGTGL